MPQSDAAPAATGDVQGNIQSAIQKDPTLSTANVTVTVTGKTVELTGTVPNKDAKDSAERIAKENASGMKVKNHLKVAAATTPDKRRAIPATRNSSTATPQQKQAVRKGPPFLWRIVFYGESSRWTVWGENAGRQMAIYSVASSGVEY